jgi:hypothetical protein
MTDDQSNDNADACGDAVRAYGRTEGMGVEHEARRARCRASRPCLPAWEKRPRPQPSPALRSSTTARRENGRVVDNEQRKTAIPGSQPGTKRPCDAADYAITCSNAMKDLNRTFSDVVSVFGTFPISDGAPSGVSRAGCGPLSAQASRRGVSTTGDQRVRNTPPRIAAAPTDCAGVIGSPSHSQAMTIAAIGVTLL